MRHKILTMEGLESWRRAIGSATLAVTNGCFDVLHAGHVRYLRQAGELADLLLVGINDDAGVKTLKGEGRPVNCQDDRLEIIAGLESVDAVCIFPGTRATEFLRLARPTVWVKGGGYSLQSLNTSEKAAVEAGGGRIMLMPMVGDLSTTLLISKLKCQSRST